MKYSSSYQQTIHQKYSRLLLIIGVCQLITAYRLKENQRNFSGFVLNMELEKRGNMLYIISLAFTIYCIVMSLKTIFIPNTIKGKLVSLENFLYLTFVYITILIGFGLIYILLETKGHQVLIEQYPMKTE